MTITHAMLARAAVRALRQWLFELGHENATIGSVGDGSLDVYHLLDVGRVVRATTAIGSANHRATEYASVGHYLAQLGGDRPAYIANMVR